MVSASLVDLSTKNAFLFSDFAGFATNIFNQQVVVPPSTDAFIGGDLDNPLTTEKVNNQSIAIANTVKLLDENVLLTVGLRYQQIETMAFNAGDGVLTAKYDESKATPMLGVVYRQSDSLSIYANYAESLNPGAIAPEVANGLPLDNAGEALDPFTGEQYEFGVKYDGGHIGLTANVFQLEQPNALIEEQRLTDSGNQQSRGLEISAFGEPIEGIRIIGGGTFIDAELKRIQANLDEGNTPIGIPELQTNINVEYDVVSVEGLTFDVRWIYTSKQYINTANTSEIDSWNRLDIGAKYTFDIDDTAVSLLARVNNVNNKAYWASTGGFPGANYLVLGEPRTVSLSANFDF